MSKKSRRESLARNDPNKADWQCQKGTPGYVRGS